MTEHRHQWVLCDDGRFRCPCGRVGVLTRPGQVAPASRQDRRRMIARAKRASSPPAEPRPAPPAPEPIEVIYAPPPAALEAPPSRTPVRPGLWAWIRVLVAWLVARLRRRG